MDIISLRGYYSKKHFLQKNSFMLHIIHGFFASKLSKSVCHSSYETGNMAYAMAFVIHWSYSDVFKFLVLMSAQ